MTPLEHLDIKAIETIVEDGLCPLCGGGITEECSGDQLRYICLVCGRTFTVTIDDGSAQKKKRLLCPAENCRHNSFGRRCGIPNDADSWETCKEFQPLIEVPYAYPSK